MATLSEYLNKPNFPFYDEEDIRKIRVINNLCRKQIEAKEIYKLKAIFDQVFGRNVESDLIVFLLDYNKEFPKNDFFSKEEWATIVTTIRNSNISIDCDKFLKRIPSSISQLISHLSSFSKFEKALVVVCLCQKDYETILGQCFYELDPAFMYEIEKVRKDSLECEASADIVQGFCEALMIIREKEEIKQQDQRNEEFDREEYEDHEYEETEFDPNQEETYHFSEDSDDDD